MTLRETTLGVVCAVACGFACMAAQFRHRAVASARDTTRDQGERNIRAADAAVEPEGVLTYSGRGSLSFTMGDLVFVPENTKPQRAMGLEVVFPDPLNESLPTVPEEEEFYGVTGQVEFRFDPWYETLVVSVHRDAGEVIERTFDVFNAPSSSGVFMTRT